MVLDQLVHNSLTDGEVMGKFQASQSSTSGSNRSGVYVLVVSMQLTSSSWWGGRGLSICKTAQGYGSGYYLQPLRRN